MLFSIPEFCPGVSTCLAQRADGSPILTVHKLWDALLRGVPGEGELMAGKEEGMLSSNSCDGLSD